MSKTPFNYRKAEETKPVKEEKIDIKPPQEDGALKAAPKGEPLKSAPSTEKKDDKKEDIQKKDGKAQS